MNKDYQVAALWIGGKMSFLEVLCLKSFVDAGQHITLYSYEPIPNVPEGVAIADANEILSSEQFLRHGRTNSPALHSDRFRYHLLAKNDHMIWADTDAYCVKPFTSPTGHFFAWESKEGVNGGVLGLPQDSEALGRLIEFTNDEYAIPTWYGDDYTRELLEARERGEPVHAGDQPWGVWGPHGLTHFLKETGEIKYALPQAALYPIDYKYRAKMTQPGYDWQKHVTDETYSIHFYGRRLRARINEKHGGIPKARSCVGMLMSKHGVLPDGSVKPAEPVTPVTPPEQAQGTQAAALLERTGLTRIERIADLGAMAPDLALAAQERFDCEIDLIDLGSDGAWPALASGHAQAVKAQLVTAGVDGARIRIVTRLEEIKPADLVLSLASFGDSAKIRHLAPLMGKLFHADSRMLMDIRAGTGAFPFLKPYGESAALEEFEGRGNGKITRVLFSPFAPKAESDPAWAEIARELAGPDGFYTDNGQHSFLYVPRGKTLVVTFDNLDIAMGKREDRRPWGYSFIEKQGWSMLGAMAGGWTWYRDPWVFDEFDRLAAEGFFAQFERVVFYGASMGGYAAAAFSAACPGADVVVISPQSTVDKAVVPWETRYKTVWGQDFSGKYGDAAEASKAAARVSILYDPYEPLDAGHAARFDAPNVMKLRAPLLGHRLGSSLNQMGILTPIILKALEGSLRPQDFHMALRARRNFPRYQKELFNRCVARGHLKLARRLGEWILKRNDNGPVRKALRDLPKS
ncbi:hypothetical protein ABEB22_13335 [Thioclava sp. 'Guangxiensis']|uniref:hypothetical protein n=1 Tax=Thioclava sp. 'Guangxiensis' TaxID=3149044 RepID=UPI003877D0E5